MARFFQPEINRDAVTYTRRAPQISAKNAVNNPVIIAALPAPRRNRLPTLEKAFPNALQRIRVIAHIKFARRDFLARHRYA